MEFREPFWRVLHKAEYRETRGQLLRDWLFFGSVIVLGDLLFVVMGNLAAGG